MKLTINIKKTHFFGILLICLIAVGVVGVVAYNAGGVGGNPAVFGHSADEIEIDIIDLSPDVFAATPTTPNPCVVTGVFGQYVDLSEMEITVTVPAGGKVFLTADTAINYAFNENAAFLIRIAEAGSEVGNTERREKHFISPSQAEIHTLSTQALLSPSAGNHTYKVQAAKFAGGSNSCGGDFAIGLKRSFIAIVYK